MISKPQKNPKIAFSEEVPSIIQDLLEKYDLEEIQNKERAKMSQVKTFEEREEIFENLPGRKIARMVKNIKEGELSVENLPVRLQKDLGLSSETAKKLAKDIEQKILVFQEKAPTKIVEKTVVENKEVVVKEKEEKKKEVSPKKPPSPEDHYREPIS